VRILPVLNTNPFEGVLELLPPPPPPPQDTNATAITKRRIFEKYVMVDINITIFLVKFILMKSYQMVAN
jgi:hypothetical protein